MFAVKATDLLLKLAKSTIRWTALRSSGCCFGSDMSEPPLSFGEGAILSSEYLKQPRENLIHLLPFDLILCKRVGMKKERRGLIVD